MKDEDEYEDEEFEGFNFGFGKNKYQVFYEDIKSIIHNSIMIMYYRFRNTVFYRNIHIGIMIIAAIIYWLSLFCQDDIKIMDADDERVIFHLPSI